MSKTELSIEESYCDGWGLYEGIREFAQNGRDAMRSGYSFDISYNETKNVISILTKGTVLKVDTLLLGTSSKRDQPNMLGYWGEGYKIGCLALLRLGKSIRIRTGTELWVPEIVMSKKFKRKVLSFDITGNKTDRKEILIEVAGVTPGEWDLDLKWKFLFLGEHQYEINSTKRGSVIVNGAGLIFVDGIYVGTNEFKHGYDFNIQSIKLDRDRRLVDHWAAKTQTAVIWEDLYLSGKYEDEVDSMLAQHVADVQSFSHEWIVSTELHRKIASQFIKKHGEAAVPARTVDEVKSLAFYGKNGQIVNSQSLREILEKQLGSAETIKSANRDTIQKQFELTELGPDESHNLLVATKMVSDSTGFLLPYVIVEFKDPGIVGMHKNKKMYLSRNILASFEETLKTVVEEVCHTFGDDGTREFQEAMHHVYSRMILVTMGRREPLIATVSLDSDNIKECLQEIPF